MNLRALDEEDRTLLAKTRWLLEKRHSDMSGVSAGLRTSEGSEFFGLCIDAKTSTVGMCAEFSAIGTMVTRGESKINTIVAVSWRGRDACEVIPPCGKCRDLIRGFGDPFVILQVGRRLGDSRKVRLSELVPYPWDVAHRRRSTPANI